MRGKKKKSSQGDEPDLATVDSVDKVTPAVLAHVFDVGGPHHNHCESSLLVSRHLVRPSCRARQARFFFLFSLTLFAARHGPGLQVGKLQNRHWRRHELCV
jgi:hypothetical protein